MSFGFPYLLLVIKKQNEQERAILKKWQKCNKNAKMNLIFAVFNFPMCVKKFMFFIIKQ
jgi:hypothetical protein